MGLRRKMRGLNFKKEDFKGHEQLESEREQNAYRETLSRHLFENEAVLKSTFTDCPDVIFRSFLIGNKTKALLIYTEGLANIEEIDKNVLSPLMQQETASLPDIQAILEQKLSVSKVKPITDTMQAVQEISSGNPVILIDQQLQGITVGLAKWEKRAIEEPMAESVVRGPRDGFTETLSVNISLLRRKIKSPDLKMKSLVVGRYSQTQIVYMYIEGVVDQQLLEEVHNRLNRIDIDGVLESGYIEEFIEDNPFSPFPQILNTERPDVAASSLLEGRVAILVDGTPFVLIAPTTLYSLFQASEDYYQRFMIGTLIRWLRYLFLLIALLLPSTYVAILTYHQEMLPTTLLLSMAKSREQVPFPALVEAIIMEITFEAIREAGIRLPKQVGSAVSIVGALVIGQAAVSSGLVSAPMVMVVAITGVASFAIPRYNASTAIRMLRFPMIVAAGTLGLLGIMLGILTIIVHLNTIRSFGVPYLSPMAPMKGAEMKDVLIRAPWWSLKKRTRLTGYSNTNRQSEGQKPNPQKGTE
ncbi:spore germination protein [Neobacillus bataviensis]|uniref:spore germination protein n=1 Tax=Neobacillus bataviensis TaxID=220685 RepID=UPI001CBC6EFC|nr:spore germination protein [Neobacillus bataviensis]